jgi:hypothetical protein
MRPLLIVLALLLAAPLMARQELVTLPTRDSVQLTIYNSEDLTLVRERRTLSFREGHNRLQFSWANTLIDPTSVDFLPFGDSALEALEVIDTSYPAQSHEMLVWTVTSTKTAALEVEISYFTSGITWSAEYVGVLDAAESNMRLSAYVTVTNHSGEEYENASVRLVVGTINLVERIIDLARPSPGAPGAIPPSNLSEWARDGAMEESMDSDSEGSGMVERKEIGKEALGEYYIYTVEGRETIPNGWSKRLQSFEVEEVPVETVYRLEPRKHGPGFNKFIEFTNDKDHNLGKEPLPDGIIRLYRDAGEGRLSWMGMVETRYIPRNDEVLVNVGTDAECTMTEKRTRFERTDIVVSRNRVTAYTMTESFEIKVRNFRDRAVRVEIHRSFAERAEFDSDDEFEVESADTRKVEFKLDANATRVLRFTTTLRVGR